MGFGGEGLGFREERAFVGRESAFVRIRDFGLSWGSAEGFELSWEGSLDFREKDLGVRGGEF